MQNCAHLVELEKCCQTHICSQTFVLIQPRTSPPKIRKILNFAKKNNFATQGPLALAPGGRGAPAGARGGRALLARYRRTPRWPSADSEGVGRD